ncbi:serine hydrolase domain-containing protein [Taibaiella chishuiensis]|uniref:D-alanyl-D-alanine carboxypeptidase n=1 Tax=Taibaiella chishuiensis TaxID=1434707 RepID=A0A2P8D2S5_9BACT|nr:serine hydrolase domain-containing protein [Taibaiella chishuiensis]PSK91527.1 D-alanyl-D-alanine carboxypeptidase [Taibaiella chishuiensis]
MRTCLYFLLFCLSAVPAQAQFSRDRLQHFIDSVYAAHPDATGFLVHVEAPDQQLSWSYAVGYADRKTKQKLTADRPVLIASNTKPYVAAAILRLQEQGLLDIDRPVGPLLGTKTRKSLSAAGYDLAIITPKHLLAHTSGIRDYVDEGYFKFIGSHKQHAWTRDEQVARAAGMGKPLAAPGDTFRYADINYLLLTEVIEHCTRKPFYQAMRRLLNYDKLKLNATWFAKLERAPAGVAPRAHQYWDEFAWDTYDLDPSWDLYGGGGMVATITDMAMYFRYLFTGRVITDPRLLARMYTDVPPDLNINYCLGIRKIKVSGFTAYNHGGGLGTDAIYIPGLNATVVVAALEARHRPLALELTKEIVDQLGHAEQ